jgi:hypothetical protein
MFTTATTLIAFAVAIAMATHPEAPQDDTRATRTAAITLNGEVGKVFPLFGPFEEKKWARGWDPQLVSAGATLQDTVFTFSHDGLTATWIIAEWDEARHAVTYAVLTPNDRAMTIRIVCSAVESSSRPQTRVQVTYTFVSLSDQGKKALAEFAGSDFQKRILHWQHAINHYLETGKQWEGDAM